MKKIINPFLPVLLLVVIATLSGCNPLETLIKEQQPKVPIIETTPAPVDDRILEIQSALQTAVKDREDILAYLVYRVEVLTAHFSEDGEQAVVWIKLVEPESGETLPGEPGLALAFKEGSGWKISLQDDPNFAQLMNKFPENLLSAEMRNRYMPGIQPVAKAGVVYTGYKLPWQGGLAKRVTGSIGHVLTYKSCPKTCMYAYDFSDRTMFPVTAAKAGRVKMAVWRHPNGNETNANFLLLEDPTTEPTTFVIYYHLAQDSIPPALRVPGTWVYQGQFLGNADDTGPSTGHHLHFHVHTAQSSHWGTSVDIVFDEVTTNGGRPRTCSEAKQFPNYGKECMTGDLYTSANYDSQPPTGQISMPKPDSVISTRTMEVVGWGSDDNGVLSVEMLANWDGSWKSLGAPITRTPFSTQVDLCQANIPNGPFLLALQVKDQSGQLSKGLQGQRVLNKDFDCDLPAPPEEDPETVICQPNAAQVSLFAEKDYAGICRTFNIGEYALAEEFSPLGDNQAASVKVGAEVAVTLFEKASFSGIEQTFLEDTTDLGSSAMGASSVSSLKVVLRPELPMEPVLNIPRGQQDLPPSSADSLTLSWQPGPEGTEFRSELSGADGFQQSLEWQVSSRWEVGSLKPGEYTWIVFSRNLAGTSSSSVQFSVKEQDYPPVTQLKPLPERSGSSVLLLEWDVLEGSERVERFELQVREGEGEWFAWGRPLPGQSRSGWYFGEPGKTYTFRIRSIDINGALEGFAENGEVKVEIAPGCEPDIHEAEKLGGDDHFLDASVMGVNTSEEHSLCTQGDVDWVSFKAEMGRSYRISTTPLSGGAAVRIQLFAPDGYNLLGEKDPSGLMQPAEINWIAPEEGTYLVRLSSTDPKVYGGDVRYQVRIDAMERVFTPGLLFSTLILPVIWFVIRFFNRKSSVEKKPKHSKTREKFRAAEKGWPGPEA